MFFGVKIALKGLQAVKIAVIVGHSIFNNNKSNNLNLNYNKKVIDSLKDTYGIDFNIPLDTEIKIGYNWLDLKIVE